MSTAQSGSHSSDAPLEDSSQLRLFLSGDVMTGQGIDQILPHPGDPQLREPFVKNANRYVELAEAVNGPIPYPVEYAYIWGDSIAELECMAPDVRIMNLETAVTNCSDYWRAKKIHYRMNPENAPYLTAAEIDCCALANNHILDWGYEGMVETLETLESVGMKYAGAVRNRQETQQPAVFEVEDKGRVIVFSFGSESSGVSFSWVAGLETPGVNLVDETSWSTVRQVQGLVERIKLSGDVVVVSVRWGGNWGYEVPIEQYDLAHNLIDHGRVDVIHGHSSHHVKGVEVYNDRPIIYGCGDFLTDYEGIPGYEGYRNELSLMYFVSLDLRTGKLVRLEMTPTKVKRFQVTRTLSDDAEWLANILNREGTQLGTRVVRTETNRLSLEWE